MRTLAKALTVVIALMGSLAAVVAVTPGGKKFPDTGAFMVKDIDDTFNVAAGSNPGPFLETGGVVVFPAYNGLWRTDGTSEGTVLLKSLDVSQLTNVDGTLFFASSFSPFSQKFGAKLWKTDGTAEGTVLVSDAIGPSHTQHTGTPPSAAVRHTPYSVRTLHLTPPLSPSPPPPPPPSPPPTPRH